MVVPDLATAGTAVPAGAPELPGTASPATATPVIPAKTTLPAEKTATAEAEEEVKVLPKEVEKLIIPTKVVKEEPKGPQVEKPMSYQDRVDMGVV